MTDLLSIRQYAKHRGVSHVAVHKHVKAGKLSTVGGKIDPAVADAEWTRNVEPRLRARPPAARAKAPKVEKKQTEKRETVQKQPRQDARPKPAPSEPHAQGMQSAPEPHADGTQAPADKGAKGRQFDYMHERAKREHYLAERARVDLEVENARLIDRRAAELAFTTVIAEAKTKLLAVPSKARQRIPHLTVEEVELMGDLIREALEEVAECPALPTI